MTRKDYILELFNRKTVDADMAVIEGVMGLFDGSDPVTSEGSTAEIARWLDAPVLLVISAHGLGRSFAALLKGYAEFEPDLRIAGAIANQSGSENHRAWLTQTLKGSSLPTLLAAIPRGAFPPLPSRHLGLVTADPQNLSPKTLHQLADVLEKHASLDTFLQMAREAPSLNQPGSFPERNPEKRRVSIGVAWDRAFHFYYPDNLEELEFRGCHLIRFSPLEDRELPEGFDGLYLGGGYPEEYAEGLSDNKEMREAIRNFASKGLPIYAECGGLMYLTQSIETTDGKRYPMVGLLPAQSRMLDRLKSLGYVEVTLTANSFWGASGAVLRGHEFHYSELIASPQYDSLWKPAYRVKRSRSKSIDFEGFQKEKILASYVHLHWASRPEAMEKFVTQYEARS
jgi:cobyrinic acid a,c-diamide synthase